MRGWQANERHTCVLPVVLGLCPKLKYPLLCRGIIITLCFCPGGVFQRMPGHLFFFSSALRCSAQVAALSQWRMRVMIPFFQGFKYQKSRILINFLKITPKYHLHFSEKSYN